MVPPSFNSRLGFMNPGFTLLISLCPFIYGIIVLLKGLLLCFRHNPCVPHLSCLKDIYSLAIKHGLLDNPPVVDDFPSYRPLEVRGFPSQPFLTTGG